MSTIESLESSIVGQLRGRISYLKECRGVRDIATYLSLSSLLTPAAIVIFDGENAQGNMAIGGAVQQTEYYWSVIIAAQSFDSTGAGRLGTTGAYQIIDDVINALEGFVCAPASKLFYVSSARNGATEDSDKITYVVRFRCQSIRHAA